MRKVLFLAVILSSFTLLNACKVGGGRGINIFSVEQDKQLGAKLKAEIESKPSEYKILPFSGNEKAYGYLYRMRDNILKSSEVKFRTQFNWELYIIHDDKTLNAFCAPGGYIYVYTGLIKYLDKADDLAGVLGHEIAHADQRHSTQQMTSSYGLQTLVGVLAGENPGVLAQLALGLTSLKFSRTHEKDADNHSVDYLCDTKYAANGAATFFQKLLASGQGGGPAFLSTHPNPGNRVEAINARAKELKCSTKPMPNAGYAEFKALMP
jgi:predicted Zn-dependent protease